VVPYGGIKKNGSRSDRNVEQQFNQMIEDGSGFGKLRGNEDLRGNYHHHGINYHHHGFHSSCDLDRVDHMSSCELSIGRRGRFVVRFNCTNSSAQFKVASLSPSVRNQHKASPVTFYFTNILEHL